MTTIACNKQEMACDLQATLNLTTKYKMKTKIFKVKPHEMHFPLESFIIGFCGDASEIIDVMDFYENPEVYERLPRTKNLSGIVLTESGTIFTFSNPAKWLVMDQPHVAMGTGGNVAFGALEMGATPRQAVQAAMKIDPYTGMGTKVLRF